VNCSVTLTPNRFLYIVILVMIYDSRPISGAVSSKGTMIAFGMLCSEIRLCLLSQEAMLYLNWSSKLKRSRRRAKKKERQKRRAVDMDSLNSESEDSATDNSCSENDEELHTINFLKGHSGPVQAVMFHPQAKLLFSVSQE